MVDPGEIRALGRRIAIEHRIFAGAGHVDRQRGEPCVHQELRWSQAIFLPAVDTTPLHDHRRVGEADLAPFLGPVIAIETAQRAHHLFGILASNLIKRVEPPGAPHEFGFDLFQRTLAGTRRSCGRRLDVHAPPLTSTRIGADED
jgi:hypothetical protein